MSNAIEILDKLEMQKQQLRSKQSPNRDILG